MLSEIELDGDEIADILADPRMDDQPLERVRVSHDYPYMVDRSHLSTRARQVWKYLLTDWGPGHVMRIAKRLKVSPGRVCQAKDEIAKALEAWDYRPEGWRRSGQGWYSQRDSKMQENERREEASRGLHTDVECCSGVR